MKCPAVRGGGAETRGEIRSSSSFAFPDSCNSCVVVITVGVPSAFSN